MSSEIQITPFGGVRENSKNMYAVEVDGDIYILDCGLKYPENELLGIDIVIPDFSYLRENADRIVGVFWPTATLMPLVRYRTFWMSSTFPCLVQS